MSRLRFKPAWRRTGLIAKPLRARGRHRSIIRALSGRAGWGVADQVIFSATSFALAVGVAHTATPAEFGAFGITYVIYSVILGTVEAFTAEVVVVRGSHLSGRERRTMVAHASGTAVALGGVCSLIGIACLVAAHGTLAKVIPPIFIPAPLLFAQDVWRFGFFAAGKPRSAVLNDFVWACLLAEGMAILFVGGDAGWVDLVWIWSLAGAMCGIIGALQARCVPRPAVVSWFREQSGAGGRFAGEYLALSGAAQAVLILVGVFAGLAQSAGYRGGQLLFGPVQVLLNAIRLATTPILARASGRGEAQRVWRGTQAIGALGGTIALAWGLILYALPTSVGEHILGRSWSATRGVLLPMSFTNFALGLSIGALILLRVKGAFRESFHIRTSGAVVIVGAGGLGATDGSTAAAIGVAAGATLITAALWRQAYSLRGSSRRSTTGRRLPYRELIVSGDPNGGGFEPQPSERFQQRQGEKPAEQGGPVPDLFVIGAMRAGTTTLCADLDRQPAIALPTQKEPTVLVRCRGDEAVARQMYRECFKDASPGSRLVDGSTAYAKRPELSPNLAGLAATIAPEAKIVYLVRNPVHRAISHHKHLLAWGLTDEPDFDRAIERNPSLINFGKYWWQLEPWLAAFGASSVRVVVSEEFYAARTRVVADVAAFVGLDPLSVAVDDQLALNESSSARAVSASWRRLIFSETYQDRIRPMMPARVRARLRDSLLPQASPDARPSLSAANRIIEECSEDAAALGAFLERAEPLWDWSATRAAFD